jgi:NitT/TauT family transport system permease protein
MKAIKKAAMSLGVALFWLALWQGAAMIVGNPLILPTPVETVLRLFELAGESKFWFFTSLSLLRILIGIIIAIPAAWLFAALCSGSEIINALFSPAVTLMKSTPVVSFILIAIFLVDRHTIPSAITFMMVFPVLFENVREGISQTPKELLEMADVFGVSWIMKVKRIYIPAIKPFFFSALMTSVGLAVKAGVAAEVVAYIPDSMGKMLSDAKSYMEPADLLAWTVVIIAISLITERALHLFLKYTKRRAANDSSR